MGDIRSNDKDFVLINANNTNDIIINEKLKARIETAHKVQISEDFSTFPVSDMPPLPALGEWVEAQTIYTDGAINWVCVQSHNRTADAPINIPALFRQYRQQGAEWVQPIDQFDSYMIGDWCAFNSTYFKSNMDYNVFSPTAYPAGWDECDENGDIPEVQPEQVLIWVQPTGAHDAYNIGDKVHFPTLTDPIYESLINANVYSPTTYPAGWKQL